MQLRNLHCCLLGKEAEDESREIERLQYELEVERKALSMARYESINIPNFDKTWEDWEKQLDNFNLTS